MQQGRHAARVVRDRLRGRAPGPFRYVDKGDVATVGRGQAVADLRGLHLRGAVAWVFWLGLHLYELAGLQNPLLVLVRWTVAFASRTRGARLITGPAATPRRRHAARGVRLPRPSDV